MNVMEHVKSSGWGVVKTCFYWLFTCESIQQIIHVFFAIILPTEIVSKQYDDKLNIKNLFNFKEQKSFWILFCVYICFIVIFACCNKSKKRQEKHYQLAHAVTVELSSDISSLIDYLKSKNKGRFFDPLSQIICNSIYTLLSDLYPDRESRVSVVAQIQNHGFKYYMAGYKSKNHSSCDTEVYPVKDCTKYLRNMLMRITKTILF